MKDDLVQLSADELIARLLVVKERALSDAFSASQNMSVGPAEVKADAEAADDTTAVIDEAIRRLSTS